MKLKGDRCQESQWFRNEQTLTNGYGLGQTFIPTSAIDKRGTRNAYKPEKSIVDEDRTQHKQAAVDEPVVISRSLVITFNLVICKVSIIESISLLQLK